MKLFDIFAELKVKGFQKAKEEIESTTKKGNILSQTLKKIGESAKNLWSKLKSTKIDLSKNINIDGINQKVKGLQSSLKNMLSNIKKIRAGDLIEKSSFLSMISKMFSIGKKIFNGLRHPAQTTKNAIKKLFNKLNIPPPILDKFKAGLSKAVNAAKMSAKLIKLALSPVKQAFSGLKNVLTGLPGMLAGIATGMAAKSVFDYANNLDQARINWKVLMGSAEEGQKMLLKIQDFAKKTPFDFDTTQKFAQQLKIAGLNGDELFRTMRVIGDAAQGNAEKAEGLATAYQQMSAKGKIQAEEMNQLIERGIPAWDMLSKSTGKTKAELMDMARKGELLAEEYLPKLVDQMDEAFGGGMAEQAKTLNGQWEQLKDNLLAIGAVKLEPLRNEVKNLLTDINKAFDGEMSFDAVFEKWTTKIGKELSKLGKVIGDFDLTTYLSKMIDNLSSDKGIGAVVRGIGNLAKGVGKVIVETDWASLIIKIGDKLWKGFEKIDWGTGIAKFTNAITKFIDKIVEKVGNIDFTRVGEKFGETLRNWAQEADWTSMFEAAVKIMLTPAKLVFMNIPDLLAGVIVEAFTGQSVEEACNSFNQWCSDLGKQFSEEWDGLIDYFGEMGTKLGNKVSELWSDVSTSFDEFSTSISEWFTETSNNLSQWFDELPSRLSKWASELWGEVSSGLSEFANSVSNWCNETITNIEKWFKELPGKLSSFGNDIWTSISGGLQSLTSSISNWCTTTFNNVVQWFQQLPGRVSNWGNQIWSAVSGGLQSMASQAISWASTMISNVTSKIREITSRVSAFGSWLWSGISSGLGSVMGSVASIGRSIVEGVWNGISGAAGWFASQISSFFSGMVASAKSALGINSPSKVFAKVVGHAIPEGIAQGIEQQADVALSSITDLSDNMQNAFNNDFDSNFSAYGNMKFDAEEMSNPFAKLTNEFNKLTQAFNDIEFSSNIYLDSEKVGSALYNPMSNLSDEGGVL